MPTTNPVSAPGLAESKEQATAYKPSNRAMVESMEIMSYMKILPANIWTFLFSNSAALQAILRSLNELDQQIIIRLCYLHHTVSEKAMRLWVQTESLTDLRRSISLLVNLHILITPDNKRSDFSQYTLEPTIKKQVQSILLNGPSTDTLKHIVPVPNKHFSGKHHRVYPNKSSLVNHSQTRWDNLLRFIVSPNELQKSADSLQDSFIPYTQNEEAPPERPCEEIVFILVRRHLLSYVSAYTSTSTERSMSREAFSWLLKDLRSQIISILMEFLYTIDGGNLSSPANHAEARSIHNSSGSSKGASDRFTASQMNDKRQVLFPELYKNISMKTNSSNKFEKHSSKTSYSSCDQTGNKNSNNSNETTHPESKINPIQKATELVQQSLLFLLGISQASIGQPFYVDSLSAIQRRLLRVSIDLGLLWMQSHSSNIFFVAPYSLLLRSDGAETRALTAAMSSLSSGINNPMKRRVINDRTNSSLYSSSMLGESWFHPGVWESIDKEEKNLSLQEHSLQLNSMNPEQTQPMDSSIIVQSNFKVYIYTSSALHISVLSHLCELQARTTNLVVGILTRESVSAAYKSGITADQIIRFLESHSHPAIFEHQQQNRSLSNISNFNTQIPQLANFSNSSRNIASNENQSESIHLLPENVIIQLKMWEAEQHRLTMESAVLFKNWQSDLLPELFQKCVRWALGKGYCLYYTQWCDDPESEEFEQWMKREKYLCVSSDAKSEMVEKFREFREIILSHRSGKGDYGSGDIDETSSKLYGFE